MPPAVIAAAIFVGASVTTLAVAAAVIGALEMIVVNLAIGALMKGLAGKPNVAPPPLNVTMKGTIEPRHLIFGTRRAGGVMVNHATSGPSNDHLWFVIVLSGHQVTKITDVWLDQIMVPDANINPSTGLVSGAKIYSLSGTLVSGSNIVSNVEVPSNMVTGGAVTGVAIPAATTITAIGLNTITLSKSATATVAAPETITYTVPGADVWKGRLYIWKHLGTSGQTVDTNLAAAFPSGWDSTHTLKGCSYIVVKMIRDDTVYTTGAPQNVTALVQGAKLYDPRFDSTNGGAGTQRFGDPTTWLYSENPALALRWYLTGGSVHNDSATPLIMYGLRDTQSRIDDPFVFAAANICDEILTGSNTTPTGDQPRYRCNLEVTTGEARTDIIQAILSSMAGTLTYVHGKWRVYAGAYDSPTHTFTQNDLYGDLEVADTTTHTQRYNQVAATYVDASNQWLEQTTIFRTDSAYESQDNGEAIQLEIDLRAVTNQYQAQRISEIHLRKSRMMRVVKLHGALNLLSVAQNEVLTFSHTRYGWSNRVFRCIERQFDYSQEAGQVVITAQREDPAVYNDLITADYDSGTSTTDTFQSDYPDSPVTLDYIAAPNMINFTVGLPTYLQAGAVIELWEYTSVTPFSSAVKLLEARSNAFSIAKGDTTVRYYWIRVRQIDGSVSGTVPAANGFPAAALAAASGPPGAAALTLVLSVPFVSVLAYADGTVISTATAHGQLTVYAGVTDVTAACTLSSSAVNCTGSINTATGTPVSGQPKGYYNIVTLTADAGVLTLTAVYAGTTLTRDFNLMRVKVGIEIVTSLPSTNLFAGRTVFLTTDNKLYRYTGSTWVTAVAAVDITGTLADAQIASLAASKVTGTLTDSQLVAIAAAKVTGTLSGSQIAAHTIAAVNIVADTITSAEIAANAITATELNAGAVTTAKLAAGAVTAATIAANTITAAQILASTITATELAAGSVTTNKILAGNVTAAQMATNTITAASGILAAACITNAQIGNLEVDNAKIANLTITTGKVGNNAITGSATGVSASGSFGSGGGTAVTFSYTSQGGVMLIMASITITAQAGNVCSTSVVFGGSGYDSYSVAGPPSVGSNTERFTSIVDIGAAAGTYTISINVTSGSWVKANLVALELKK